MWLTYIRCSLINKFNFRFCVLLVSSLHCENTFLKKPEFICSMNKRLLMQCETPTSALILFLGNIMYLTHIHFHQSHIWSDSFTIFKFYPICFVSSVVNKVTCYIRFKYKMIYYRFKAMVCKCLKFLSASLCFFYENDFVYLFMIFVIFAFTYFC